MTWSRLNYRVNNWYSGWCSEVNENQWEWTHCEDALNKFEPLCVIYLWWQQWIRLYSLYFPLVAHCFNYYLFYFIWHAYATAATAPQRKKRIRSNAFKNSIERCKSTQAEPPTYFRHVYTSTTTAFECDVNEMWRIQLDVWQTKSVAKSTFGLKCVDLNCRKMNRMNFCRQTTGNWI